MNLFTKNSKNNYIVYFIILCLSAMAFLPVCFSKRQVVGDGSEYYAMYLAFQSTHRPWMTEKAFAAYKLFVEKDKISGICAEDQLKDRFPSLRVNQTADFNHFWSYSLLAYFVHLAINLVGFRMDPNSAFLMLHFLLFATLAMYFYSSFKWRGVICIFLITLSSPIVWYMNKVHTEFLTYCCVAFSVGAIITRNYLLSAFFLAVASTQNPSFALISFIPFAYRFTAQRGTSFSIIEVLLAIATSFIVCVHPFYYFLRYGVPTPQLLAGGASIGGNNSYFYIWLLDPDIGLFPNWPLGVLVVLWFTVLVFLKKNEVLSKIKQNILFLIFCILYICINLYAQSSTTNINSGASIGVARYATWYIPLLFPLLYFIFYAIQGKKIYFYILFTVSLLLTAYNIFLCDLNKRETHDAPSYLSHLMQSSYPKSYDPHPEIFAERFSGLGEAVWLNDPKIIIGPDFHKILVFPESESVNIYPKMAPRGVSELRQVLAEFLIVKKSQPFFYYLNDSQKDMIASIINKQNIEPGEIVPHDSPLLKFSGWSVAETSHRWSDGYVSSIRFKIDSSRNWLGELKFIGFSNGDQSTEIILNGTSIFSGKITPNQNELVIRFDPSLLKSGENMIQFKHPQARSVGDDTRLMALGLKYIVLN